MEFSPDGCCISVMVGGEAFCREGWGEARFEKVERTLQTVTVRTGRGVQLESKT